VSGCRSSEVDKTDPSGARTWLQIAPGGGLAVRTLARYHRKGLLVTHHASGVLGHQDFHRLGLTKRRR
jgi:hypothetical protein